MSALEILAEEFSVMKFVCSSMMVIWFAMTDIRVASYNVEPVRNASGSVYALY